MYFIFTKSSLKSSYTILNIVKGKRRKCIMFDSFLALIRVLLKLLTCNHACIKVKWSFYAGMYLLHAFRLYIFAWFNKNEMSRPLNRSWKYFKKYFKTIVKKNLGWKVVWNNWWVMNLSKCCLFDTSFKGYNYTHS